MSLFHTLVSIVALISGGVIFFFIKGTALHRKIGFTYALTMGLSLFTSFFIYEMFDGFGPFHVMSIVAVLTISIGMYFPLFGRNVSGWPIHHYFWMSYSYVGLWMALMSHFIEYFPPDWSGFLKAFVAWGIPYLTGTVVLFANKQRMIDEYAYGMHQEKPVSPQ